VLERWLKGVRGGGGELRNTTFALLDPSGEKALARTGRSPQMVYKNIDSFAVNLASLANKFESKVEIKSLPLIPSLRLGLNIAACDGIPLVVIINNESRKWKKLFSNLVNLSQTDSLSGQAHYVLLKDTKEIENLKDYKSDNFVYILKPDSFGITGRVVAAFRDKEDLSSVALGTAFDTARISKKILSDSRQHVRQGRRKGITWESQMPRADGNARSTSPGDRPHLQE
jgi:hypothetical protein